MTTSCKTSNQVYNTDGRETARILYFDKGAGAVIKIDHLHMWTAHELRELASGLREVAESLDPAVRVVE